jgi:hypothetical protein
MTESDVAARSLIGWHFAVIRNAGSPDGLVIPFVLLRPMLLALNTLLSLLATFGVFVASLFGHGFAPVLWSVQR